MKRLYLSIDLGTSAVKALVADGLGATIGLASADCPLHQPGPGRQEQALDEVHAAMILAVRGALSGVDPRQIRALAFSSAMHGMMPVDEKGRPLSRMLTWADGRSGGHATAMGSAFARTGCPPTALYYPGRIKWFKENEPGLFARTARFVSIKDVIFYRLTGRWAADRSHASSNGLLDLRTLDWDRPLLEELGLDPARLPDLVEPDEAAGALRAEAAAELGLPAGLPVAPGAGDGGLANLGSGAVNPGQAAVTIGTSGAMRKVSGEPHTLPGARTWCYYLAEGRYYIGGAINSGGIIMRWLRDGWLADERDRALALGRDPYELLIELAASAPAGAEGLVFLPYLFGERTPYWNPAARGMMFGLSPRHGKAHLARAALEGICMAVAHVYEALREAPGEVAEIRASGGFARSEFWLGLLADVLGAPVSCPKSTEGSALGAAVLAMKAAGDIASIAEAVKMTPVGRVYEPDRERSALYAKRFELFKDLYRRVEGDFGRLP